jgi:parallel beta-helix repeat protein
MCCESGRSHPPPQAGCPLGDPGPLLGSVVEWYPQVSGGTFDGIDLVGTTGANVSDNTSLNNAFDGIFVDGSSNNSITDNEFEDNGQRN